MSDNLDTVVAGGLEERQAYDCRCGEWLHWYSIIISMKWYSPPQLAGISGGGGGDVKEREEKRTRIEEEVNREVKGELEGTIPAQRGDAVNTDVAKIVWPCLRLLLPVQYRQHQQASKKARGNQEWKLKSELEPRTKEKI